MPIHTKLQQTTLTIWKDIIFSKSPGFSSYKKTMAHTLLIKKSKQELTRKRQTIRKDGTQSFRPKLQNRKMAAGLPRGSASQADATRQKSGGLT